jgi:hypothetical protein
MNKLIILFILIFGCIGQLFAQYIPIQDKYWVVADSMKFEFNSTGLPIISTSPFRSSKRAGATYLDSVTGFYCYANGFNIWDSTNQFMAGCQYTFAIYQGAYKGFFIPSSSNADYLYFLSIYNGWIGNPLFLTTIDKAQNNGLGKVIAEDTIADELSTAFLDHDTATEGFRLIRHGDGKQWWALTHILNISQISANTTGPTWIRWLVNNDTVTGPFYQDIGLNYGTDLGLNGLCINEIGTKVAVVSYSKKIELFDFDRCTGLLNNNLVIDSGKTYNSNWVSLIDSGYISCAFSPTGRYLFVNSFDTLWQYDMEAENISNSRNIIWYDTLDIDSLRLGCMELGPDGRIYLATTNLNIPGVQLVNLTRNQYNTWMGVVFKPDSAGLLCDFKRHGLYLDGHISNGTTAVRYNTQLGVWVGSPCDPNVTGVAPDKDLKTQLKVFPNPTNDKFNITWPVQGGYTWALKTIASVTISSGIQKTGNATISTGALPEGMYFLEVHSAKEHKVEKVIIVR